MKIINDVYEENVSISSAKRLKKSKISLKGEHKNFRITSTRLGVIKIPGFYRRSKLQSYFSSLNSTIYKYDAPKIMSNFTKK